jgi:hypothetical protein
MYANISRAATVRWLWGTYPIEKINPFSRHKSRPRLEPHFFLFFSSSFEDEREPLDGRDEDAAGLLELGLVACGFDDLDADDGRTDGVDFGLLEDDTFGGDGLGFCVGRVEETEDFDGLGFLTCGLGAFGLELLGGLICGMVGREDEDGRTD